MQVSVESTSGLERRMTVEIPAEGIDSEVGTRLDNLMRTARIPGFRPGKAPLKVVARRFGAAVRDEVVGDLLRSSFSDALAREELRPAGEPVIDSVDTAPGTGLKYTAVFEVFPDIRLAELESIEIRRPTAEVQETDVDRMVETLRERRREWREVARAARPGDRITFDIEGEVGRPASRGEAWARTGSSSWGRDKRFPTSTMASPAWKPVPRAISRSRIRRTTPRTGSRARPRSCTSKPARWRRGCCRRSTPISSTASASRAGSSTTSG